MNHAALLFCILFILCASTLASVGAGGVDCASVEGQWERIYPGVVSIKQTGLFARTITWQQRSDAARVVIEAKSWTKPEGIEGQAGEYPYTYYVTEVVTGQPGYYTYVQKHPVRPDIFVGYYLTEYQYLDQDEPCYGYGVYWFEPSQLTLLPLVRH